MKLNPQQDEAVHYIDGPCLVLAGAGSGKTRVIINKIAYLVQTCGYKARNIAAVTFTNKAAREMKERLSQTLGKKEARGLTISTFHTLGLTIIKREIKTLGMKPAFTLFDSQDSLSLLKELTDKELESDKDQLSNLQNMISNCKNDLILPEQAIAQAQSGQDVLFAQLYQRYQQQLKAYNALDFDDLIMMPTLLLKHNSEVRERWQNRFHYLLVDEYQDTNTSQYQMVKLLTGTRGKLTVVGDDDQSIYSWRGAKPQNLVLLQTDFPNLKLIKLEQNYRSSSRILRCANILIANNPHVYDKTLFSALADGAMLRVIYGKNEEHEAERVVAEIIRHKFMNKTDYGDFAILYRGNFQSRIFEKSLMTNRIPYKISGGTSFFSRSEIKDIMGYLRLLINPTDDSAFLRIINTPRREIGPSTIEKLSEYSIRRGISMMAATTELGLEQLLTPKALDKLKRFGHWLGNITRMAYADDAVAAVKEMIEDLDYEAHLQLTSGTPHMAERRMSNVWYLVDSISKMIEKADEIGDEVTIEDAVSKLILRDMLERQADEDEEDQVQLMTLHASKGLEFPHVYMVGLEEELMPHRNSIEADTVEEERRLMYVGITRAQRTLTITYAAKRKQFGELLDTTHSRFLDELPQDDIEWEGKTEVSAEEQKARGQETMASLKNLMADF